MEYLHLLQVIRQRIWLALLGVALGALVVVCMWVLPISKTTYTARGRILVDRAAQRQIDMRGAEFVIEYPQSDSGFWASLVAYATGPDSITRAINALGEVPDAETRYGVVATAERLAERRQMSNYVVITCKADRRDLAERLAQQLIWQTCTGWMQRQTAEAQAALDSLREQLPTLTQQLSDAQRVVDDIEAMHGGVGPDKEVETLTSTLLSLQLALQTADLESSAGQARSAALAQQPERGRAAAMTPNPALAERVDRVRQDIMDREVQLAEMKTRRTSQHPAVKELERQIETLRERAKALEKASDEATSGTSYRQEAEIAAAVYAREMAARQALLAQREADLRGRLSKARTAMASYVEARNNVENALKRVMDWKANIAAAEAELAFRRSTASVTPQPLGDKRPSEEEMASLLAKAATNPQAPTDLELARLDPVPSKLPQKAIQLLVATVVGFAAGCLVVLMLHFTDTTFRNEDDAARLLGCPILGGVPRSDVEIVLQAPAEAGPQPSEAPPQ